MSLADNEESICSRGWTAAIAWALVTFLTTTTSFTAITVSCWDAASEFNDSQNSDAANPSGVWSYGWKKSLADKFFLAVTPFNDPPNISGWSSASGYPVICHNSRPVPVTSGINPVTFPPHVLLMHPGPNGEYAVVRFTAPTDGSYKVSGQFYAQDDNATGTGTTTDVWVLANNSKTGPFSGKIDYYGASRSASITSQLFQLKKGNTLDFQVGYGTNKTYEYDVTGLVALVEKIK